VPDGPTILIDGAELHAHLATIRGALPTVGPVVRNPGWPTRGRGRLPRREPRDCHWTGRGPSV
jgi:hypothetical protein